IPSSYPSARSSGPADRRTMDTQRLRELMEGVRSGTVPIDEALIRLRDLPYEDLGFAKLDHHRALRNGFPEVILCQGKSIDHIIAISQRLRQRSAKVLATRATPEVAAAIRSEIPDAVYHDQARIVVVPGID